MLAVLRYQYQAIVSGQMLGKATSCQSTFTFPAELLDLCLLPLVSPADDLTLGEELLPLLEHVGVKHIKRRPPDKEEQKARNLHAVPSTTDCLGSLGPSDLPDDSAARGNLHEVPHEPAGEVVEHRVDVASYLGNVREGAERREGREAEESFGSRAEGVQDQEEGVAQPIECVDVNVEEGEEVEWVTDHLGYRPGKKHSGKEGVVAGLESVRGLSRLTFGTISTTPHTAQSRLATWLATVPTGLRTQPSAA